MKQTMQVWETNNGGEHVMIARKDGTFWCDNHSDYFPTSQTFEADVFPLPIEDVTGKRIDGLEAAKEKAHAEWLTIAAAFDDKIAKLRAIPHLSSTDDS